MDLNPQVHNTDLNCDLSKSLESDSTTGQAGVDGLVEAEICDKAVQAGGKGGQVCLLSEAGRQDLPLAVVQLAGGGQEGGQEAGKIAGEIRGRHVVDSQADFLAEQVVGFGNQHLNNDHCFTNEKIS